MTEEHLTDMQEARRRKLDELFSDQPFLSATMRAARLHERMTDSRPPVHIPVIPQPADDEVILRLTEARREFQSGHKEPPLLSTPLLVGSETPLNAPSPTVAGITEPDSLLPAAPPPVGTAAPSEPDQGIGNRVSGIGQTVYADTRYPTPDTLAPRPFQDEPEVMTVQEAARFLRVGEGAVRRWANKGNLPFARLGRYIRFRRAAILQWLAEQERLNR